MGIFQSQIGTEQLNLVPGRVLVIEDPNTLSDSFLEGLDCLSRQLVRAKTESEALEMIASDPPDVILLHSLEFLDQIRGSGCESGIVMTVSPTALEDGARALELGAQDFLIHPLSLDQVAATLSLVGTIRRQGQDNERLVRQMNTLKSGDALVGCCPASRRLKTVLARAAESSVTVLIEGPSGAGKSLAAQIIHTSSRLSAKRLEVAYGDTLTAERVDHILADGRVGTLLLENVDQLLSEVQSRIVRHIKERSAGNPVEREGVRIIATTSAHLPELVARSKFREDLYYRLNVFPINVPSLRERRENIAVLATHFLKIAAERTGEEFAGITDSAMTLLESHHWPGNVAQLQDVIVRAHALTRGAPVDRKHLHGVTTGLVADPVRDLVVADSSANQGLLTEEDILPLEAEEKRLLARALKATKGNVRRAAQLLRIGRATLYRKIQVYKLKLN